MSKNFTYAMFLIGLLSFQLITPLATNAAEPYVFSANTAEKYSADYGQQIIITYDFKDHWGKRVGAQLRGSRNSQMAQEVCVVAGFSYKCLSTQASYESIKQQILIFKKRDKASLTGICALIQSQYDELISKTKSTARRLLQKGKSEFTNFSKNCTNAIVDNWPNTRYSQALGQIASANKAEIDDTAERETKTDIKSETRSQVLCDQNSAIVRSNQIVLKDLGFYTSIIDGISGPNYRRAVTQGEQLLGFRADTNGGCLNASERQILSIIYEAGVKGSECTSLLSVNDVKSTFEQLQTSDLTKKLSLNYESVGGVMWMIDTISDLEKRLSFTDFYNVNKSSQRDCRLDKSEINALSPKEPVNIALTANTLSMTTLETIDGTSLRLIASGEDLETSKMAKSVFGGNNELSIDIRFTTFKGKRVLDFVISEKDTKINLHLYEDGVTNPELEVQMPELFIDEQPGGWSAFYLRMFNNGSTNIQNGEFAKIVTWLPENDNAMLAALCGHIEKLSSSSEGLAASFAAIEDRDVFRRSNFSSQPVREAIGLLAKQCVDAIRTEGFVTATFDIEVQEPICTAKQNELLAKLDTDINEAQTSLQDSRDEITATQVERPEFELVQCDANGSELEAANSALVKTEQKIASATATLSNLNGDINEGKELLERLRFIVQPSDLCNVESADLKERINVFIQSQNPAEMGLICSDDTAKSPIQIVIDEINATISLLLDKHISSDEIAELGTQIGALEQQRNELTKLFATTSATKASPNELDKQAKLNEGLRNTVADIEVQVSALEGEIFNLRSVMEVNASLIGEIDTLNQQLVQLTSEKLRLQDTLRTLQSDVLQSNAAITQRELQIEKAELQTQDLEVQLGVASSTSVSLQQEVDALSRIIETKQENVDDLNMKVESAQAVIDETNSVVAQNSQEVATFDVTLNARNDESVTLSNSLETLSPQADAAEQTVLDLETSLVKDFVPIDQYREQEARLNDLTQIVTERTTLIRELRADLVAIEAEEQLLVKMCLADAQCKVAMGDRLGEN